MTLQECYEKIGGDYEEVTARLTKDERITKYVVKFLEDPTYQMLCEARKAGDDKAVFLYIHTLKGVSQNLGFGNLYEASYEMTEAVRGGVPLEDESLFEAVKDAYLETIAVIEEFAESL
ncbi:MAG: Hpt domain-containing protein [Roseburia sp.]|nr:Hpt domain-containing protein [Roseburia sp.]